MKIYYNTMFAENKLSSPAGLESNSGQKNHIYSLQKESNKHDYKILSSDIGSSEKSSEMNNLICVKDGNCLKERREIVKNPSAVKCMEKTDLLQQIEELDYKNIHEMLSNVSEHELLEILEELESANFYISKENEVYEFILNDDEILQSLLGKVKEVDKDISAPELFELPYPAKCYFSKKKLEYAEKAQKQKNDGHALELQNLNFELESLNKSLKDLNESKEKFDKDIRIDGRHPVTKKIMLEKVIKYFDDSVRTKMDLTNRYKIQIQGDMMEQNKTLIQIKAQEKRLAFLDLTEFQEAQFEYKKSCRELAMYKEQLGKYKAKLSFLLQKVTKLKKDLEREENDMEQMKNAVIKLKHLKDVMLSEKTRNDEKVLELKAAMRKIKLDPRRHNLPEVIDYAAIKRDNVILVKTLNKWKKKVEAIQQEKLLYLNALTKKKMY